MRYMSMLIVMTAMVFVAAGSAQGITSPGSLIFGSSAAATSFKHPPPPPPPPPPSKRCPPSSKDDQRDRKCGKGGDSKLP
jgi:hypothetical protein